MIEAYGDMQARVVLVDRDNASLRDRAMIAERQNADLIEKLDKKNRDIAILEANLQGIADRVAEFREGSAVADKIGKGEKPFSRSPVHAELGNEIEHSVKGIGSQNLAEEIRAEVVKAAEGLPPGWTAIWKADLPAGADHDHIVYAPMNAHGFAIVDRWQAERPTAAPAA